MDPPPPPPGHQRNGNTFPSPSYPLPAATALLPSVKPKNVEPFIGFSTTCSEHGKAYALQVSQQPVRARMCGFGDKDRRPITPPPCIRLLVRDSVTDEEIDISEIDTGFFVLTVDLWSADGKREVNLVRHSATSPSISAATSSSYPPPQSGPVVMPYPGGYHAAAPPPQPMSVPTAYAPHPMMMMHQPMHQPMHHPNAYHPPAGFPPPQYAPPPYPGQYYPPPVPTHQGPLLSPRDLPAPVIDPRASPSGMFTRNLIGSLCVSAFKLTCPENNLGVWFILQDLSVRTEGTFRLKMNFVNVGSPTAGQSLNNGTAPVLASIYSDIFTVYSAKKFPGVIESTELSKCFALQGIKIPIRKDGARGNVREKEEDDDDS